MQEVLITTKDINQAETPSGVCKDSPPCTDDGR